MAVLNLQIASPGNGQEVSLPFEMTGSVDQPANPGNLSLQALARQIDDNTLVTIPLPNNPTNFPFAFFSDVSAAECPDANTWYMLTVYAWDSAGDCTLQSVTFKRVANSAGLGVLSPP
jgi:hypothetical protein